MTTHRVELENHSTEVKNKPVQFVVYQNNKKIGELQISKGGMKWVAKKQRSKSGISINWGAFARFMEHFYVDFASKNMPLDWKDLVQHAKRRKGD